jgi:hypothetical protein
LFVCELLRHSRARGVWIRIPSRISASTSTLQNVFAIFCTFKCFEEYSFLGWDTMWTGTNIVMVTSNIVHPSSRTRKKEASKQRRPRNIGLCHYYRIFQSIFADISEE